MQEQRLETKNTPSEIRLPPKTVSNDRYNLSKVNFKVGKWEVVLPREKSNAVWNKIAERVQQRDLWYANISVSPKDPNTFLLKAFTSDFNDRHDITQVLAQLQTILKEFSITAELTYKSGGPFASSKKENVICSSSQVMKEAKDDLRRFFNLLENCLGSLAAIDLMASRKLLAPDTLIPQFAAELGLLDEANLPLGLVVRSLPSGGFRDPSYTIQRMQVLQTFLQKMHPIFHNGAALFQTNISFQYPEENTKIISQMLELFVAYHVNIDFILHRVAATEMPYQDRINASTCLQSSMMKEKIMRYALELGANIDACDKRGRSALFCSGDMATYHFLMSQGAKRDPKLHHYFRFVKLDNLDYLDVAARVLDKYLLLTSSNDINITNSKNNTALLFVCEESPQLIDVFLKHGADPYVTSKDGTLLHGLFRYLINAEKSSIVQTIVWHNLKKGIDKIKELCQLMINDDETQAKQIAQSTDTDGNALIHLMLPYLRQNICPSLVDCIFNFYAEAGVSIDIPNAKGLTPLAIALQAKDFPEGRMKAIERLRKEGAQLSQVPSTILCTSPVEELLSPYRKYRVQVNNSCLKFFESKRDAIVPLVLQYCGDDEIPDLKLGSLQQQDKSKDLEQKASRVVAAPIAGKVVAAPIAGSAAASSPARNGTFKLNTPALPSESKQTPSASR